MMEQKNIVVLGSTGSIGKSVADIVQRSKGRLRVVGLGAGQNLALLVKQVQEFSPRKVAVMNQELAQELAKMLPDHVETEILWGKDGYNQLASMPEAELVVSAMVGAAGLIPTITAIEAGKDIALANKETLVAAGPLVMSLVEKHKVNLLPIDSEHSAIFQCLQGYRDSMIQRIILTASGGPFRDKPLDELADITPKEAVAHPNWSMGAKISVDSSTLMNKGLEVIEARWLFSVTPDKIDVVVHPQSIVHSMVEYIDGSIIAQMGIPDMRVPISYALYWPDRMDLDLPSLDLLNMGPLTFEAPQMEKFPCLGLAYEALEMGGTATTVLNAANEVAVEAFLQGRISYLRIPEIIRSVLHELGAEPMDSLDKVLQVDALARLKAEQLIEPLN